MKGLFKFVVFALGVAVIAFSVNAIINRLCADRYCACGEYDDDFNEDF
ncbi:MAG: hypothetical protein FWG44_06060 [Oscillospiraceae bacterium]|nr:hypothetical protein [Oscillospiraceae bacterium]